ncbi:hypothetical protein [Ovoidimarina sediminis]|uniref:hypothetical protein n=1 Tax=Ovoidimarina sediminis TaxID=3079856 RepID=UPI0029159443|nr:hypothetical protein [Rhodophyticola sp. MJ-SS7]MDU8944886.1 hypothetical protein [Rhodophyticola sp. MJ-SS7]
MIVLAGVVLGGSYGAWLAKKREGTRADMAQYAAGFGIAFGLLGLFLTIILERMA